MCGWEWWWGADYSYPTFDYTYLVGHADHVAPAEGRLGCPFLFCFHSNFDCIEIVVVELSSLRLSPLRLSLSLSLKFWVSLLLPAPRSVPRSCPNVHLTLEVVVALLAHKCGGVHDLNRTHLGALTRSALLGVGTCKQGYATASKGSMAENSRAWSTTKGFVHTDLVCEQTVAVVRILVGAGRGGVGRKLIQK